jgi:hypothetical protein
MVEVNHGLLPRPRCSAGYVVSTKQTTGSYSKLKTFHLLLKSLLLSLIDDDDMPSKLIRMRVLPIKNHFLIA